jgi:hypothetical protein
MVVRTEHPPSEVLTIYGAEIFGDSCPKTSIIISNYKFRFHNKSRHKLSLRRLIIDKIYILINIFLIKNEITF